MPLPKCLSSGPNNRSSNDPSSGSENNIEDGKSKVVGAQDNDNPSSEPLLDVSGVATTNKISSAPTGSCCLDVNEGSKASNVDVVSCENTQNPKREFINPKPAVEEGDGSKRKRGEEEEIEEVEFLKDPKNKFKMMDLLNTHHHIGTSYARTIISEFVQDMRVAMGRKRATPSDPCVLSARTLDPSVLSARTLPRGFSVSAFGRHIPEGPHPITSYEDMDTESEDDSPGDEVNSNKAV